MTADDRRFEVLRAIVSDYVATREPVGSKSLVDRHHLGVSPATIRNDMAVLEDEGYIAQPHTSALVSAGYGSGNTLMGGLAVVGPTRMDYPGTMAAVRAVARYVGEIVAGR